MSSLPSVLALILALGPKGFALDSRAGVSTSKPHAGSRSIANFDWSSDTIKVGDQLPKNLVFDDLKKVAQHFMTLRRKKFESKAEHETRVRESCATTYSFCYPVRVEQDPSQLPKPGLGPDLESYDADRQVFSFRNYINDEVDVLFLRKPTGQYSGTNGYGATRQITRYAMARETIRMPTDGDGRCNGFDIEVPMAPAEARKASGKFRVVFSCRPHLPEEKDYQLEVLVTGVARYRNTPTFENPSDNDVLHHVITANPVRVFIIDSRTNTVAGIATWRSTARR